MSEESLRYERIWEVVDRFMVWLEGSGDTSYDHQSYYAGIIGRRAKALYYRSRSIGSLAVAPMVFSEALMPQLRRFFHVPMRFPIADAHYAMGFAFLSNRFGDGHYLKATGYLRALEASRCPGFKNYCWGYPFDWVTGAGTIREGTPLITTTPYVFEAFQSVFKIDGDERWLEICRSIAEHAANDIKDFPTSVEASSCSYTPFDEGGVVNAAAYRAFLLITAALQFNHKPYEAIARRNLNFVLEAQRSDGSWFYSVEGKRDFVDHFHTCFVLKALTKISRVNEDPELSEAIQNGVRFYLDHLFTEEGLPKPFARAPRLTVYRNELYDYAECINLCLLLRDDYPEMGARLDSVVNDVLERWIRPNGSFRSRKLLLGWDNVPMHRWAQSQMFRSLALYLKSHSETVEDAESEAVDVTS